jgi:hypothetical protein
MNITLPKLDNKGEKVSLSERLKSTAMKFKDKFSKSKLTNVVSFSSKKKDANSLQKILSFMQKSHDRKIQMYGVEKLFQEELVNEEQRRHEEFVKTLKNYVAHVREEGSATLVVSGNNQDEEGLFKKIYSIIMKSVDKAITALTGKIEGIVKGILGSIGILSLLEHAGPLVRIARMLFGLTRLVGLFATLIAAPEVVGTIAAAAFLYGLVSHYNQEQLKRKIAIERDTIRIENNEIKLEDVDQDIREDVRMSVVKKRMMPQEAQQILDDYRLAPRDSDLWKKRKKEIDMYGWDFLHDKIAHGRSLEEFGRSIEEAYRPPPAPETGAPPPNVPPLPPRLPNIDVLPEVPGQVPGQPRPSATPQPTTTRPSVEPQSTTRLVPRTQTTSPTATQVQPVQQPIEPVMPTSQGNRLSLEILPRSTPETLQRDDRLMIERDGYNPQPIINNNVNSTSQDSITPSTASSTDNTSILAFVFNNSRAYV